VNAATGTATLAVPLPASPGRDGVGPQVSLSYDSGAGNGPFGWGWTLGLPTITRSTDKRLPLYRDALDSDVFVLSGAEELVPELAAGENEGWLRASASRTVDGVQYRIERYRPRIEGLFARIERWTRISDGDTHWRSITRDNVTTVYGRDEGSRIVDPVDSRRIYSWLIAETRDDLGNAVVYEYESEDSVGVDPARACESQRTNSSRSANRYLRRVQYGNTVSHLVQPDLADTSWLFELLFDYLDQPTEGGASQSQYSTTAAPDGDQRVYVELALDNARAWDVRLDPSSTFRPGFDLRTYRLCHRILMIHHFPDELGVQDYLVGALRLDYDQGPVAAYLSRATHSGYVRREDGRYLERDLPPLDLAYSRPAVDHTVHEVDADSLVGLPHGIDDSQFSWTDLDGAGIAGALTEQQGAWLYKRNLSPLTALESNGANHSTVLLADPEPIALVPSLPLSTGRLLDLTGDSSLDLVSFEDGANGFHRRLADRQEGWSPFRAFDSPPAFDLADPNLRFVDLDGDGIADVLVTEQDRVTWYPSLAEDGFGAANHVPAAVDEERGPVVLFADGTKTVQLADMSGDGLVDLVRIRNGEVCYWPNLGGGRFGAKVPMGNPPLLDEEDLFTPDRVRLADVDGSGTTDLVYLAGEGVRIYFNQAGNGWSDSLELESFPPINDVISISVFDLLGTGTACLVWSSSLPADDRTQVRYVDMMGGSKPHLLVSAANNLGAETRLEYAPSTRFYLEDERARRPWRTRLPFPVHVVKRVETFDAVSRSRFVTRSAYHHGYFDHVEREFRGFGMVERWDTEEFATADGQPALGVNIDDASNVPPVLTRTWFHIGSFDGGDVLAQTYADEYWSAGAQALAPAKIAVPQGLGAAEAREAHRALKGSLLREESYALDGTPKTSIPYRVVERSYAIRTLQPRAGNEHAVFLPYDSEEIDATYERNHDDPMLSHTLTLEVDDFGVDVKTANVAYGRATPDPGLAPSDQQTQARTLITYLERDTTNVVDADDSYRAPLVADIRRYELTGFSPSGGALLFESADFVRADPGDVLGIRRVAVFDRELPFEQPPTAGRERRLVERTQTLYRADDLTGPLPTRHLESRALAYDSYRLALTSGLVTAFGDRTTVGMLQECGYVQVAGDPGWWAPSGRSLYAPPGVDAPADELDFARVHFFRARRFRDPFHTDAASTERVAAYDVHDLLLEEDLDPLGNRTTAGERAVDPTQPLVRGGNDYRVLGPSLVMDANRNQTIAAFDALGLVVGTAVMGKPEDDPMPGDRLTDAFEPDPTPAQAAALIADPTGEAAATLLDEATTRFVYDLAAYERDPTKAAPVATVELARESHVATLAAGEHLRIRVAVGYSDGLGRQIQRKTQAEPGLVPRRNPDGTVIVGPDGPVLTDAAVSPRWIGTGWTIYDNKGHPVREFEPFFTERSAFERDARVGVSTIRFHDPAGRIVAALHPDRTWEKVVFDAWTSESWDGNDTVLDDPATDPHVGSFFTRIDTADYTPTWYAARTGGALGADAAAAAAKTAIHAATPITSYADAGGHPFLSVALNRFEYSDAPVGQPPVEERHETRTAHDVDGHELDLSDALGRTIVRRDRDMLGRVIHSTSMDSGERWTLYDVVDKAVYAWDGRDQRIRSVYDRLRRPLETHLRLGEADELLVGRSSYGESVPGPESANVRGRLVRADDQAGTNTSDTYDFKGNLVKNERRLAHEYSVLLDWGVGVALDDRIYTSTSDYDALNRPIRVTHPDGSVFRPTYNQGGLLETLDANVRGAVADGAPIWTTFIADVDYDAKGRRILVEHGAASSADAPGVTTSYTYDSQTFRLAKLVTRRAATPYPDDCPDPPPDGWPGCQIQNLSYTYDAVGNLTHIADASQQTIFFRNRRVEPMADFTYDARYRLIEARGREHVGQAAGYNDVGNVSLPSPGDGNAMGTYVERYVYDFVGNVSAVRHRGSDPAAPGWTRTYAYDEPSELEPARASNRLTSTTIGASVEIYSVGGDGYDALGNALRMPQLQTMQWDFGNRLRMTRRQAVNANDADGQAHAGERTWYVYDAAGARVRKVTESAPGQIKDERIYVGRTETFRRTGAQALVRETLHVMDGDRRIALVETRIDTPAPETLIRYQFGDHLASATLELDDTGHVISYEEYTPYGCSAYQAVRSQLDAPKRYRYTGRERDEESGLYYHGARYYIPWLARWTSPDPVDAVNLYAYCRCNPVQLVDPNGRQPKPVKPTVGRYGTVAGDHVHQVASRTSGPGAKRTSAPQFRNADSISTKDPAYNDKAGQAVERSFNRAEWGVDYDGTPGNGKFSKVTLTSSGDTMVGKTCSAAPSPWAEDLKSYAKIVEAGVEPVEAANIVGASSDALNAAGAVPQRVPGAPKNVPGGLKQGQSLSPQEPTRLSGAAEPAPATSEGPQRPGGGGGMVGTTTNVAAGLAVAGQTLVQLHEGHTGEAAKTAVVGTVAIAVMSKVPALVPLAIMKSTIDAYDENVQRHSFAVGEWVSDTGVGAALFPIAPEFANRVVGGVASATAATGESLFQGTFGVAGRAIGQGAAVVYIRATSDEYTLVPWRSQLWSDIFD